MADLKKYVQTQATTLYGAGAVLGSTSVILSSLKDLEGNLLTMTDFGTLGYGSIEPGTSGQEEAITFTGVTQNVNGTATLTGVKNQLGKAPYTQAVGLGKSHAGGTLFVLSNTAGFYDDISGKTNDEIITGVWTFTAPNYPKMDSAAVAPVLDEQFTTKKYVDDIAIAGSPKATNNVFGISKISSASTDPASPIVLNIEEVSALGGTPDGVNKVVRANADGKIDTDFISDGTDSALEIGAGNGTQVKIKTDGGLLRDADGLSIGGVLPAADGGNLTNLYEDITSYVSISSANIRTSALTERSTQSLAYVKLKEILFNDSPGTIKVSFGMYNNSGNSANSFGRIYKNGVAFGTERTTVNGAEVTYDEDLSFTTGDLIQIYAKISNATFQTNIKNFKLSYDRQVKTVTNTINVD